MIFREITFGSDDYRKECRLRDRVLRQPLGLRLAEEDLAGEQSHLHFGLFDRQEHLLATVIAVPLNAGEAKVRQMAVAPEFAGRGFGSRVLRELEDHLRQRGVHHISLHARATVVGFYQRAGYAVTGPEFEEVGIPHVKMRKSLDSRLEKISKLP